MPFAHIRNLLFWPHGPIYDDDEIENIIILLSPSHTLLWCEKWKKI
jgi:hypothetical protein